MGFVRCRECVYFVSKDGKSGACEGVMAAFKLKVKVPAWGGCFYGIRK